MKLIPSDNYMLVQQKKLEKQGSMFIPASAQQTLFEVTAVGPNCKFEIGTFVIPNFKQGQKIQFGGTDYICISDENILATVET